MKTHQCTLLGDVLERNLEQIRIEDNKKYKQVTVRLWGKGVQLRNEVFGHEIKSDSRYIVKSGQFIISKIDARNGASGLIPDELDEAVITGDFLSFNIDKNKILPEYLYWLSRSNWFVDQCTLASSGTTNRVRLNESKFQQISIPLPDIPEQTQIVEKIERAFTIICKMDLELTEQKMLSEKLRQGILQKVIQGQLVDQNLNDETAAELMKRIREEKERLIKEKKIKKEKPLPPISPEEIPYELPKGWEWVRLGDIVSKLGAGKTPLGGEKNYQSHGIKFIRSQNVWNDGLVDDDIAYISDEINESMKGSIVCPDDILLNITGASIGRSCLLPEGFDIGNVNQHVAIIRLIEPKLRHFVHKCIISPMFQKEIMNVQVGVSREGLSMSKLSMFLIPLPPLREQERIIQKLEELMHICKQLEQNVEDVKNNSEQVIQAILYEAFQIQKEVHVIDEKISIDNLNDSVLYFYQSGRAIEILQKANALLEIEESEDASESFFHKLSSSQIEELKARINKSKMTGTLGQLLRKLAVEREMMTFRPEVFERAGIRRDYWSRLLNDTAGKPSKEKLLSISFLLKLNLVETLRVLRKAGFTLDHEDVFDTAVIYLIEEGIYDVGDIHEYLEQFVGKTIFDLKSRESRKAN
ncbi:restriction endonuclease subunit S [Brevibacillus borstelensis]|uniref:restriction endonuclease subunit S n=1 Tax=Brevibacillus borstelensis TaxID=45462 RepID=UPI002040ED32|nr:restriction endonuclease subunit S [Brevibacillus borstelensis]MCM3624312.1 restriction endonuclease subunit S [Brevibacillus borstelensis]